MQITAVGEHHAEPEAHAEYGLLHGFHRAAPTKPGKVHGEQVMQSRSDIAVTSRIGHQAQKQQERGAQQVAPTPLQTFSHALRHDDAGRQQKDRMPGQTALWISHQSKKHVAAMPCIDGQQFTAGGAKDVADAPTRHHAVVRQCKQRAEQGQHRERLPAPAHTAGILRQAFETAEQIGARPTPHQPFGDQHRQRDQAQRQQVGDQERTAAVLTRQPGQPRHVSDPDRRAGADPYKGAR